MNYSFMPSLKHRALVKIAIALCNQSDVRDLLVRLSTDFFKNREEWKVIDEKVKAKVQELPLPESLKKEVLDLTQPVCLEIRSFKETQIFRLIYRFRRGLLDELCWTPQGTVDEKKTAEVLIKDESLDIITRYRLACFYCLEDNVKELWNSMSYVLKESFYASDIYVSFDFEDKLVVYWTDVVERESPHFSNFTGREISPYLLQFEQSAIHGNKAATEYFWQKLTPSERDESLVKCAANIAKRFPIMISHIDFCRVIHLRHYASVLCFLLSQMNEEQQVKVFMFFAREILTCLLDWPWLSFFIETANRVWKCLSENDYALLLRAIVYKMTNACMDYNYQRVFREFWQQSPNTHKKFIIRILANGSLLSGLFHIEDKENIRLILKSATIKEREEIIFNLGKLLVRDLNSCNKWDLLRFFIQECISSKDIMIKFKTHMISKILENDKDKFFSFFDDLIHNEKRGMEEATSSSSKKTKI